MTMFNRKIEASIKSMPKVTGSEKQYLTPQANKALARAKKMLVELIDRSMEKRERHSRSYPRELKSPGSPFPRNNTEWNLT